MGELKTMDAAAAPFKTGVVYDERMVEHECLFDPEYPECPQRFSHSLNRCREHGLVERCTTLNSRPATDDELLSQHTREFIDIVKSSDKCEDHDYLYKLSSKYDAVYFHPSTYELALLSVGCTVDLVTQIVEGKLKNGMAIIRHDTKEIFHVGGVTYIGCPTSRILFGISHMYTLEVLPPGHHAMRSKACGYCLFNNVAIAAQHALDNLGVKRILIVDWDVHHGQATQYAFYDDPRVLYFSIHRYEHGSFWPELRESDYDYIGKGKGSGFNINVPLNKTGMGNAEYLAIFHQVLLPVAHEYSPELIIISAGYDAAIGCREGRMEVTPAGYAHMTSLLMTFASGKVAAVLEGGYCLKSLAESVALTLRTLLGDPCPTLDPMGEPHPSVVESILNVITVHRPFWSCFKLRSVEGENLLVNGWPDHVPSLKYVGHPPAEDFEFPVTGFYPMQTPEEVAQFDVRIEQLIAETVLSFPANRTCIAFDKAMTLHRNFQEFHPERPERIIAIIQTLKDEKLMEKCKRLEPRKATMDEILLFTELVNEMKETTSMKNRERCKVADKYRSIYLCEQSYTSALTAVGCVLQVVDEVLEGKCQNGVAVVRPPGHHAERDESCGFCVFNNVAIATKYALDKFDLKRILIVDWDIHHGNGIQNAFYDDPRVLYISIHRYNNGTFFPGSTEGNYSCVGKDTGQGFNINIPWNLCSLGDGDYVSAFHQLILPVSYQFQPQLVIVSAGFDAAKGDPLGQCDVSPEGYGHMTQMLSGLAGGKLILALEGGYDLKALSSSFAMCVKVLQGQSPPALPPNTVARPGAAKAIRDVISVHKQFWPCLKFQVNFPSMEPRELEGAVGGVAEVSQPQPSLTAMLASLQLNEAVEEEGLGPYAIQPKTDCPHLDMVQNAKEDSMKFSEKLLCSACHSSQENWICLTCYQIYCGRYVNCHMLDHFHSTGHCIAFSSADFSVWCYRCESYIEREDILGPIIQRAHLLKFGL